MISVRRWRGTYKRRTMPFVICPKYLGPKGRAVFSAYATLDNVNRWWSDSIAFSVQYSNSAHCQNFVHCAAYPVNKRCLQQHTYFHPPYLTYDAPIPWPNLPSLFRSVLPGFRCSSHSFFMASTSLERRVLRLHVLGFFCLSGWIR